MSRILSIVVMTAICGALAVVAGRAPAVPILWDGSGSPTSVGYTQSGNIALFSFDTPSVGTMTQIASTSDDCNLSLTPAPLIRSQGWLVEWGIDVTNYVGSGGGGVAFLVQDDVSGCNVNYSSTTSLDIYDGNFAVETITAGYHEFRLEMPAGGTGFMLSLDGSPISGSPYTGVYDFGLGPIVYFGDGSGGGSLSRGADALWDYVNVIPIPEPSTFILSALGLLGLAFVGRRRRR